MRKGQRVAQRAHGPELGTRVRSALPNERGPSVGLFAGYALDFEQFAVRTRASGCLGGFANHSLSAGTTAMDLEARIYRAWDVARVSMELGLGAGVTLFRQDFETDGLAPTRHSAAPFLSLGAGAALALGGRFAAMLDVAAETSCACRTAPPSPRACASASPCVQAWPWPSASSEPAV